MGYEPSMVQQALASIRSESGIVLDRPMGAQPHGVLRQLIAELQGLPVIPPEDPAAVAARGVMAIFAYGTLRGDFKREGDGWGATSGARVHRGRVHGYQLWQDLRDFYPYTVKTDQETDRVFGTLLAFDNADVFYDRLQVCDLIEEHNPHGTSPSAYERSIAPVHLMDSDQIVNAYIYYMVPTPDRQQHSVQFPSGDWLASALRLRGELS